MVKNLDILMKYVSSGNISFIIGAGASFPAIKTLGNLENELTTLGNEYISTQKEDIKEEMVQKINAFIEDSMEANRTLFKLLFNSSLEEGEDRVIYNVLNKYQDFVSVIYEIMLLRSNDKYPKKVNVFTTNYDMFLEIASERLNIPYNEGGYGYIKRSFSTKNFQKKVLRLSDFYAYEYEEPSINIIKLHGSINWLIETNDIYIKNELMLNNVQKEFIDERGYIHPSVHVPIILPTKQKFVRTLLEHIYYDISRFYANELEREQSVLFCFGFSFDDEHIRSITKRALGNPSLTLIIFPFSNEDEVKLFNYFKDYRNVKVVRFEEEVDGTKNIRFINSIGDNTNRKNIDFDLFLEVFNELLLKAKKNEVGQY